jgi:hypothetical protein
VWFRPELALGRPIMDLLGKLFGGDTGIGQELLKKAKLAVIVILSIFYMCLIPKFAYAGGSCDVEKVIGARVSPGVYKITVKRESQNLYKVRNQDIYIKTRYCYEYAYSEDVILEIEYYSGYSIGTIYFP